MSKYVIIGGSAGGIGAVEAIREVDPVGSITVISEEPFPQYSRPMIADYLSREATFGKMKYRDDHFWGENQVQALTGRKAVSLNLANRRVELDGGDRIDFEKLLIATGAKPFIPRIEGVEKNGVFTFTSLSDAEAIAARIEEVKRAVVIGGGRIGVSVAEALVKRGVKVTIVQRSRILSRVVDATTSGILEKVYREARVNILTGHTVQKILGRSDDDSTVGGVALDNGEKIPCDLVVFAIGVVPRTELVVDTEVKVNHGIIVDRFMRTNVPEVYACGDVAEAYDFVWDENRVLPNWPVAHLGGKVAGYNMAGKRTEYPGGTMMSALKYFDVPIISVGLVNPEEEGYEVLVNHDPDGNLYKKVVLKDGVVVGMTFVNDIERTGIIFYLMKNRVDVESFKQKLLSEDFGLVSLPERLRRRMLLGN
jgi:NAD(P)H-nitrite reductase large subunit